MKKLAIFLSARYERRNEMEALAAVLQGLGHRVVSRWVWAAGATMSDGSAAEMDIADIRKCDLFIAFTESERYARGGRHVELGAAIALGKVVVVVGPREHVFHSMPGVLQIGTDSAQTDLGVATALLAAVESLGGRQVGGAEE